MMPLQYLIRKRGKLIPITPVEGRTYRACKNKGCNIILKSTQQYYCSVDCRLHQDDNLRHIIPRLLTGFGHPTSKEVLYNRITKSYSKHKTLHPETLNRMIGVLTKEGILVKRDAKRRSGEHNKTRYVYWLNDGSDSNVL